MASSSATALSNLFKTPMAEPRKNIDWEKIEAAYRAGKLSLREIAAEFGISHVSVDKRAKRDGWTRDLSAKIKAKAEEMVNRAEVNSQVNTVNEKEIVEANAQAILDIRLSHRKDIRRAKNMVAKLFAEVDAAVATEENQNPAETLTIPQRVDCVRKLTDSAKTLITMEREAWGIKNDDDNAKTSSLSDILAAIDGSGRGLPSGK